MAEIGFLGQQTDDDRVLAQGDILLVIDKYDPEFRDAHIVAKTDGGTTYLVSLRDGSTEVIAEPTVTPTLGDAKERLDDFGEIIVAVVGYDDAEISIRW